MDRPFTLSEGVDSWNTIIFLYRSALKEVSTKVEILNDEFQQVHQYNPIEYIKSRIKSPESIVKKLKRYGYESSIDNMVDYIKVFSEYSRKADFVIHVTISSDFSCCYQNACLAAADYDNVYVVDSRNLSTGHGLVVLEAVRLAVIRQQGMDAVLIQQSDHLTGNGKIGIFDSVWKKKNGQALFPFPGMVSK